MQQVHHVTPCVTLAEASPPSLTAAEKLWVLDAFDVVLEDARGVGAVSNLRQLRVLCEFSKLLRGGSGRLRCHYGLRRRFLRAITGGVTAG